MDLRNQKRRSMMAIDSSISLSSPAEQAPRRQPSLRMKLVTVGDGGAGKTSLLIRYLNGAFSDVYVPTVFENYTKTFKKDNKLIEVAMWDTAGQEEYDRLRALSYPETDVCLVCYSVDDPISLENAFEKWVPEIQTYCPGAPYILVGCKSDSPNRTISRELGEELAASKGAYSFVETSAKTGQSVDEPVKIAIKAVLKPQGSKFNQPKQLRTKTSRDITYPKYPKRESRNPASKQGPSGESTSSPTGKPASKSASTPQGGCCLIL